MKVWIEWSSIKWATTEDSVYEFLNHEEYLVITALPHNLCTSTWAKQT